MRTLFYILMMFFSFLAHATDISIKVIPLEGKPAYLLQVGSFIEKDQAEQLQKKLAASIKQPMNISQSDGKGKYIVQIGPLSDYTVARELQKSLTDSPLLVAQEKTHATEAPSPELSSQKIWNLRNADIRSVIAEVSRITGKNFLIDPRVQGKVSIASSTPMSDKELYQVFLSMLQRLPKVMM